MGGTDNSPHTETEGENNLLKHFDKGVDSVKDCFKWCEQEYIRPLLKKSNAYSQRRPLSAVFLAYFVTLSSFPVLIFLITSLAVIAIFTATALGIALIVAASIILILLTILTIVLIGIFFAALFFAFATVSGYLLIHFFMLARKDGLSAAVSWVTQIVKKLLMRVQKQSEERLAPVGRDIKTIPQSEDEKSSTSEPVALAQDEIKIEGEDFSDYAVKEQGE